MSKSKIVISYDMIETLQNKDLLDEFNSVLHKGYEIGTRVGPGFKLSDVAEFVVVRPTEKIVDAQKNKGIEKIANIIDEFRTEK